MSSASESAAGSGELSQSSQRWTCSPISARLLMATDSCVRRSWSTTRRSAGWMLIRNALLAATIGSTLAGGDQRAVN